MARINQGDKAPDFTVKTHSGEKITLSDLLRENVVVLFFYLDLPLEEVARIAGLSTSAARGRLYRSIRRLRPSLVAIRTEASRAHSALSPPLAVS